MDCALSFVLSLETSQMEERGWGPNGLAFHRWLPNGREDELQLETGHPGSTLVVWTQRWGVESERERGLKEITYRYGQQQLTPEGIAMQGRLSSGPLFGELATSCTTDERDAVLNGQSADLTYVPFGKRLLKLLVPPLQRFVATLQLDFGQYWLKDFEGWDSRRGSLGQFYRSLQTRVSFDGGTSWTEFTPDTPIIQLAGSYSDLESSRRHLSQADWETLPSASATFPLGSVAVDLIARARELQDFHKDIRLAIVETATAAEVAVDEYLAVHSEDKQFVKDIFPDFEGMPAQARFTVLAATVAGVTKDVMLASAPAWQFRHEVVHNGWRPQPSDSRKVARALAGLQEAVATVLGRGFRSVSAFEWGTVALPERWDAPQEE